MIEVSLAELGYFRMAVVSPALEVADVRFNLDKIKEAVEEGIAKKCQVLLFPELAITGYTCADLFYQTHLLKHSLEALTELAFFTQERDIALIVGAPFLCQNKIFNCAFFLNQGKVLGIVPKTYLPTHNEYYEQRWFTPSDFLQRREVIWQGQYSVPIGTDLLFILKEQPECQIGIEICEDLWSVTPLSEGLALNGATVLCNPSASNEFLGKYRYREQLVNSQAARCIAAYAYASAGPGESSTDLVFSGHSLISENGVLLAETKRYQFTTQMAIADLDISRLEHERARNTSFLEREKRSWREVYFSAPSRANKLLRTIDPHPFVPEKNQERAKRCREIFTIQVTALIKRLSHIKTTQAVIGLSGGLDSTLALLVTMKAFHQLQIPPKQIMAVTMPGLGTTERTRSNAEKLAELLGVTLKNISILAAVEQHFKDIQHDPSKRDVTYENSQARERTQILMDIANQVQGIVIGTGDLSELALGWCTYNADHMSMYGVNAGVPKTLVKYLVEWCYQEEFSGDVSQVLADICDTPISPELLPPDSQNNIHQITEQQIGPYELHDFFLFESIRHFSAPKKTFFLACQAFQGVYPPEEILDWLEVFYRRFFAQQYKRSCLPDGPKVGSVSLSPRGDWRMPSDAKVSLWQEEVLLLRSFFPSEREEGLD